MSYQDHADRPEFIGLYGRRGANSHNQRIFKRYKFLMEKFQLGKDEAWQLARELEKWWPDGT